MRTKCRGHGRLGYIPYPRDILSDHQFQGPTKKYKVILAFSKILRASHNISTAVVSHSWDYLGLRKKFFYIWKSKPNTQPNFSERLSLVVVIFLIGAFTKITLIIMFIAIKDTFSFL